MKLALIVSVSIPSVISQFVGDGDDYDSPEYNDDYVEDDIQRKGVGRIPGKRTGGRKRMIKGMAIRNFWEFEHYGCWCLEKKGHGPVKDEVDFACMTHSKCWGCAMATHGDQCDGLITAYRWKFVKDTATNKPIDIKCVDTDPCKRDVCECDRALAINLRNMESVYNEEYRDQSKKHEQCPRKEPETSLARTSQKHDKPDACCGDETFKFPYASNGGLKGCCGTRTYSTELLECCDQATSDIRAIGSCPSL